MRVVWLMLLLVVGCGGIRCPEGYVASSINGSAACISVLSYCERDDQCSSANFDCAKPCVPQAVNVLFSTLAHESSQKCKPDRCVQVPYVESHCVDHQCLAIPHTAHDLIPLPSFLEIADGVFGCYVEQGQDSVVRFKLHNNASTPLMQLEAYFNVSLRNGSTVIAKADLLNGSMHVNETRRIEQRLGGAVPSFVGVYAVRTIPQTQVAFGVRNRDEFVQVALAPCRGQSFK